MAFDPGINVGQNIRSAMCPNYHRKMHVVNNDVDIQKLIEKTRM
ncbi:MAG: hypothetical protein H6Q72_1400 [Firmicutes bacterium]|nr:hypothetical protein [Bacillota bacterium]